LTELPNRALFIDRVAHEIERQRRRRKRGLAVMFLDINGFKAINDTLGHAVGDRVLTTIAERIRLTVRPGDTVARLGGDEFAVLIEDLQDVSQATTVADRIIASLREAISANDEELFVSISIGIATPITGDEGPAELLQYADLAMYRAKERQTNSVEVFQPKMQSLARERIEIERELRIALEQDQLSV